MKVTITIDFLKKGATVNNILFQTPSAKFNYLVNDSDIHMCVCVCVCVYIIIVILEQYNSISIHLENERLKNYTQHNLGSYKISPCRQQNIKKKPTLPP